MRRIGLSPGRRQKLAGAILKDISEARHRLDIIEKDTRAFYEDAETILIGLDIGVLTEAITRLTYRIGEANGALQLPDLVDGELARAEGES